MQEILNDFSTPALVNAIKQNLMDLAALTEEIHVPVGLKIKRLEDEQAMKTWAHIFVLGYGLTPGWEAPVLDMLLKIGIDFPGKLPGHAQWRAGSNCNVFYSAGVAGIQMVATLPEMRGEGIGAAL